MTALRRVAPLPLLLLVGVPAIVLALSFSDSAQAQYNGPDPEPPPEHRVPVDWPLIPSGLGPGDSFRLLFLTSTKRSATSSDIGHYIAFVHERANNGHSAIQPYGADFRPVISTENPGIDARAVISYFYDQSSDGPGRVPVYWINGAKVADDSADFFDNSWDSHDPRDERGWAVQGSLDSKRAWTGSRSYGVRNFAAGRSGDVRTGTLNTGDEIEGDRRDRGENHRLYAMSPVFTVDRTKARATFGQVERRTSGHCTTSASTWAYSPRYLSGPAVVYRGNTYTYEFTHNAEKSHSNGAQTSCSPQGASIRGWVGLVSGTGTVSAIGSHSSDDAAWLERHSTSVQTGNRDHPHEYTTDGKPSACYRTNSFHRTQSHGMQVYIPNNAPRGSTFEVAFFQRDSNEWCTGQLDTRWGLGTRGWGTKGSQQVEPGRTGTVTVAPVPDAPGTPYVAWGPTRNSVRIEFPANTHDGNQFIYSYGVEVSRHLGGGQWTPWQWAANVDHGHGTRTVTLTGLQPNSTYNYRVFARARMWDGGQTYYGPATGAATTFQTRWVNDPDPPTNFRVEQVFYNRARVAWDAPSHTGRAPLSGFTVHARRWTGTGWSDWGWAAGPGAGARNETVTGYFEGVNGGSKSWADFQPHNSYQLRIDAVNRQGTDDSTKLRSAWSEIVWAQTPTPVPLGPERPSVSDATHNSVRVSFPALTNDGAQAVYRYVVQLSRLQTDGVWTGWATALDFDVTPGTVTYAAILRGPGAGHSPQPAGVCRGAHVPHVPGLLEPVVAGPGLPDPHAAAQRARGADTVQPADPAPAHRRVVEPPGVAWGDADPRLQPGGAGGERLGEFGAQRFGHGHDADPDGLQLLRR